MIGKHILDMEQYLITIQLELLLMEKMLELDN